MSSVKRERDSELDGCGVVAMVVRAKLTWKLPNSCPGNPTRAATMASPTCPNCGLSFKDTSSVLKHMNHRFTSCHHWFTDNEQPPPPVPDPMDDATSHYFPGAGHIFGSGSGFIGWFASDEDAEARSVNPFYPFLSCSGLLSQWYIFRIFQTFFNTPYSHFP